MPDFLMNGRDGNLMTDPKYSFISSSMMRKYTLGKVSIEGLVPDEILKRMNSSWNK